MISNILISLLHEKYVNAVLGLGEYAVAGEDLEMLGEIIIVRDDSIKFDRICGSSVLSRKQFKSCLFYSLNDCSFR